MSVRALAAGVLFLFCAALATAAAPRAADDKKPGKKAEKNPEVVIYFHTGAGDTKDTRLPKGMRIRLRVEAGNYEYNYDGTTIKGETVGDIAEQLESNMKAYGWNATLLKSGLGIAVSGGAPKTQAKPQPYKTVTKAGILYSTKEQPVAPKAQGGVRLLDWDAKANKGAGGWVSKPNL